MHQRRERVKTSVQELTSNLANTSSCSKPGTCYLFNTKTPMSQWFSDRAGLPGDVPAQRLYSVRCLCCRGTVEMLPAVIVVLMLVSLTCGENPAVQVVLTDKGLQYGKHVGAGWVQDKLPLVSLPEISGKVLGINYALTGSAITKCDFPEPSVEFYQNSTGFKTSISGLSVALTGEWRTYLGIIHDGGSFNMAVYNMDVTSVVTLGKDASGHPSVTSVRCAATVGDADIRFHGGASWMFQSFVKYFRGRLKNRIEGVICPYVEGSIVNLEYHLQAMKVSIDVAPDFIFDLPLTGKPVVDASSVNLGLKGEFYNIKTHEEPPFKAQPFTLPEQPGYMLSVGLSEFTLNSASFGLYKAGLLGVFITDNVIFQYFHVHLNTSSMGPYIPQLPKMFPGLLMYLQIYARDVPMFSFQPGLVKLDLKLALKAFAIQPNGTSTPLCKLNVDSQLSSKVWIADGRLKGSITLDNFTVKLDSSEVGPVKTDSLERLMKGGMAFILLNLNAELGKGVIIPRMKQAQLVNPVLGVKQGFIAISSDAEVFLPDTNKL